MMLWLRIALDWDVGFLARPMARYRVHDESVTGSFSADDGQAGYVQTVESITRLRDLRLRFVDDYEQRLPDPERLRGLVDLSFRHDLIVRARALTLPQRRLRPTVTALAEAARANPRVVLYPPTWTTLVASVVGGRGVEAVRRRRRAQPGQEQGTDPHRGQPAS